MVKAVLFDWGRVLRSKTDGRRAKQLYELADELRSQDIRTGVVSNINWFFSKIVRFLGDYRFFAPVILSCEVKMRKPNPAIFRLAATRTGVKTDEVIFVDNRQENIDAAKGVGMKVVLAKNTDQIVKDVKKLLLRENNLKL